MVRTSHWPNDVLTGRMLSLADKAGRGRVDPGTFQPDSILLRTSFELGRAETTGTKLPAPPIAWLLNDLGG